MMFEWEYCIIFYNAVRGTIKELFYMATDILKDYEACTSGCV